MAEVTETEIQATEVETTEAAAPAAPLAFAAIAVPHVSFAHRVFAEFKKLFKRAPDFETTAATTIVYLGPVVLGLEAALEPEAVPATALLLTKIQAALAGASAVIKAAGPKPTLLSYLNAVRDNALQLEAAVQIKDPALKDKLTAATTIIVGEIDALASTSGVPVAS